MATAVRTGDELAAATDDLRREVLRDAAPYTERLLLAAESFRESEGEVYRGLRMAKATRHIFERMPVKIRRGEILLGWHPSSHPDQATQQDIAAIARVVRQRGAERISLLPFNPASAGKYGWLRQPYPLADATRQSDAEMAELTAVAREACLSVVPS